MVPGTKVFLTFRPIHARDDFDEPSAKVQAEPGRFIW